MGKEREESRDGWEEKERRVRELGKEREESREGWEEKERR